jgi:hypothetical protein
MDEEIRFWECEVDGCDFPGASERVPAESPLCPPAMRFIHFAPGGTFHVLCCVRRVPAEDGGDR